jgi:hypothetical protein
MSSPIPPISGPTVPPGHPSRPAAVLGDHAGFISQLAASERVEASRGAPPREVLDQIAAAGAVNDRLREGGAELRFLPAEWGRRVTIELHDGEGNVRTISAAEALDIVAGKPVE